MRLQVKLHLTGHMYEPLAYGTGKQVGENISDSAWFGRYLSSRFKRILCVEFYQDHLVTR